MQITWHLTPRTSYLHALWAAASDRPLADSRLCGIVLQAATDLSRALAQAGLSADTFWEHALPLADEALPVADWLSATLSACGLPQGVSSHVPALVPLWERAETQVAAVWPAAAEELVLRHRPLREQWEARGPGLLAWLCRQWSGLMAPRTCRILGVLPVLGGGGWLHRAHQAVRIECVLANPRGELPELLRLTWLIAQAVCAWPDEICRGGSDPRPLAGLALLPATLAAADDLELASSSEALVTTALSSWIAPGAARWAGPLWEWWHAMACQPCPWPQALLALTPMLIGISFADSPRAGLGSAAPPSPSQDRGGPAAI